jgi:hypothetical protein
MMLEIVGILALMGLLQGEKDQAACGRSATGRCGHANAQRAPQDLDTPLKIFGHDSAPLR